MKFDKVINKIRKLLQRQELKESGTYPVQITPDYYDLFSTSFKKLSVRSKQQLMYNLYADENFFVERFTDYMINPVVGREGFRIKVSTDEAPATEKVFWRFSQFNGLLSSKKQREIVRDLLLTGEYCVIVIEKAGTYQLLQVHASVIRQTIVDPGNYNQIVAVEMEQADGKTILLKTIVSDEEIFTEQGKLLRKSCLFSCYLFQLRKRSHPTIAPYAAGDPLRKYEIRGEPYLINSADLLQAIIKYLWSSLDRAESFNRFNYLFNVDVDGETEEEIRAKIAEWKEEIGTPQSNSSIFLPPHIQMKPVSFSMQSADNEELYRMFRNAAAWHAAMKETSMGEGQVRYASNEKIGIEEPTIQAKEILQGDLIQMLTELYNIIGERAFKRGDIPRREINAKVPLDFKYKILFNEISKQAHEAAANAAKTIVGIGTQLKLQQIGTTETVNNSIIKKVNEILGTDMLPIENILEESVDTVLRQRETRERSSHILRGDILGQENIKEINE
jgi:hypothetical protein